MSPNPRDSVEKNSRGVWAAWEGAQYDMGIYKANLPPFSIHVDATIRGVGIENEAALQVLLFFWLDAAWLNEVRCPGGRPSVS